MSQQVEKNIEIHIEDSAQELGPEALRRVIDLLALWAIRRRARAQVAFHGGEEPVK
jgi:hypothetical protein